MSDDTEDTKLHLENENDRCSLMTQNSFAVFFNLVWFLLFADFAHDSDKHNGDECVILLKWSYAFAVYSLICVCARAYKLETA
jgi:hypothetical protein